MEQTPLRVAVIMAGGVGERFWPLSRRERPKQLLRLASPERSMLEESIGRIRGLVAPDHIYVITSEALAGPIRAAGSGLPDANILAEPCKRNTAGALTYAAAALRARLGDRPITMAVLTSDHRIEPAAAFEATAGTALEAAEAGGGLITIGIVPTRPETGYGYIETAGTTTADERVMPVERFCEKPDPATAQAFAASGRHFWNSGMFFWRLDAFERELAKASPAHDAARAEIVRALAAGDAESAEKAFASLDDISIDYALMEKCDCVSMAPARFEWDDIGALDAIDRCWSHDGSGNVTQGDPVLIDTRDSIVINEPGTEGMAVATIGVEGMAVVVTRDGVLVMPKERAQSVRQVVDRLKERGAPQL